MPQARLATLPLGDVQNIRFSRHKDSYKMSQQSLKCLFVGWLVEVISNSGLLLGARCLSIAKCSIP